MKKALSFSDLPVNGTVSIESPPFLNSSRMLTPSWDKSGGLQALAAWVPGGGTAGSALDFTITLATTTVINSHELRGLKQCQFIFLQFWTSEV